MKYVLIPKFCADTGYTPKAIERKIAEGVWTAGLHYRKAPDGRIHINTEAVEAWVEGQRAPSSRSGQRSGSSSPGTARAA